jgi:dienelactone hydrolase
MNTTSFLQRISAACHVRPHARDGALKKCPSNHSLCFRMRATLFGAVLVVLLCFPGPGSSRAAEREVSFETEDGLTIYGMYGAPEGSRPHAPAVVFLHSFDHDRGAYGQYLYPGLAQLIAQSGVATLRIDLRGRGRSIGEKELHSFSSEELSKVYLDVRAAVAFLSSQEGVDPSRLAIVAEGMSADAAVMAWRGDGRIRAIALISGKLSEAAKKQIAQNPEIPLCLVVSKEDRAGFRDMVDAYKLTNNTDSRISVYKDIGMGTTMFSVWRSEHPKERPIEEAIAEWVAGELKQAGERREVFFKSNDGWTIYGTLWSPGQMDKGPVPGVVLIHSSFTDRHIFDKLAELIMKRGLVALNIDTRGRGRSTGRGEFVDLPVAERENGILDVNAAVNFLSSQSGVGSIGLLGTDRGASYALKAALDNPRVGGLVLMTTLLGPQEAQEISKLDIPVFFIASKDIEIAAKPMAEAYKSTRNRGSRILIYNGGALGYEIFGIDETLEPTLADWLKEQLSR